MRVTVGSERNRIPRREWVALVTDYGGAVSSGPAYRLVWGYSDVDRYMFPERWLERWHLEWWSPVSNAYERIVTFEEGISKNHMEPTLEVLRQAIGGHRLTRARSHVEIRRGIEADMLAQQKAEDARKEAVVDGMTAAFPFKSWIPVSGPATPESRRKAEYGGTT